MRRTQLLCFGLTLLAVACGEKKQEGAQARATTEPVGSGSAAAPSPAPAPSPKPTADPGSAAADPAASEEDGEVEAAEAKAHAAAAPSRREQIKQSAAADTKDPAKTCERVLAAAITCRKVAGFRKAMDGKLGSLDDLEFKIDICPRWIDQGTATGGANWKDAKVRETLVPASLKAVNGAIEDVCPAFGTTLAAQGGMPTESRRP
jgi:hypothetical protein